MEQLDDINVEGTALDSLQLKILSKVNLLRNRVSINLFQASDIISDMKYFTLSLKLPDYFSNAIANAVGSICDAQWRNNEFAMLHKARYCFFFWVKHIVKPLRRFNIRAIFGWWRLKNKVLF